MREGLFTAGGAEGLKSVSPGRYSLNLLTAQIW